MLACEQAADFDGVRRTRWLIVRRTHKELRETIAKTLLEWFPEDDWGVMERSEPMRVHWRREHPSGDGTRVDCEIILLPLPDEQTAISALASFEITGAFVNEGQFVELGVVTELLSRCSRYPSMKNGPGATWFGVFIDLNAPKEGHWIPYMRGDVPLPPEWSDDLRQQFEKPPGWTFFVQPPGLLEKVVEGKVVYEPNPLAENQKWLREPYMEKIRGWDREKIDERVLNKVGLMRGGQPVYPTFLAHEHVAAREIPPVDGLPIIVGLDFGREPAAVFMQNRGASWIALSELIGTNEAAIQFAPRVARHIAQHYPGFVCEFYGDPRGADPGQNDDRTAYDIFRNEGMRVTPATSDNNPEMRRSTVNKVLMRRDGLKINPSCVTLKSGMNGGYFFRKIAGTSGIWTDKPVKNVYSHIVEAMENALMGGGEGFALTRSSNVVKMRPSPVIQRKVRWGGHH